MLKLKRSPWKKNNARRIIMPHVLMGSCHYNNYKIRNNNSIIPNNNRSSIPSSCSNCPLSNYYSSLLQLDCLWVSAGGSFAAFGSDRRRKQSGLGSSFGEREMEHVTINGSKEVIVGDPLSLENKISSIRLAGPQKLQVIADFDATLTKYWIDGRRGQSSHGLLQQGNSEFDEKRQKLYEYYHPLEFDPTIPLDQKAKLMEEWWGKTHALLIEGGLTYDAIKTSVANATIAFREGVVELFEFLEEKDVPVLVFSAGLADIIEELFRQKLHRSSKNVRIVSNRMIFDQNGQLLAFKGKTIHVLNKNEHALDMAAPVHDRIDCADGALEDNSFVKKRTNVLLLGDHIGDLGMSDGLDYETRISIGFLNDNIENSLESYQKAFDLVYLNDASMKGVWKLATQLCTPD